MRTVLRINLDAIAHNYQVLCGFAPASEVGAVVKANAYGLGMEPVSRALYQAGCRLFMVVLVEEGVQLRAVLKDQAAEIWVFNGPVSAAEVGVCAKHQLTSVLNTSDQVALYKDSMASSSLPPVLAFDTGMNRLGLSGDDVGQLQSLKPRAVMSHLACSSDTEHPMNREQLEQFSKICEAFPGVPRSLANSGGMFLGEAWQMDICRPGIALYGGLDKPELQRVITVEARVLQVRRVVTGESVGYNARWTAERDSWVAIVGLGYADGWRDNGLQALVDDTPVPVVGEISMDLIALDVTGEDGEPRASEGETATLIGDGLSLGRQAERTGRSTYELLTGLGERHQREYLS